MSASSIHANGVTLCASQYPRDAHEYASAQRRCWYTARLRTLDRQVVHCLRALLHRSQPVAYIAHVLRFMRMCHRKQMKVDTNRAAKAQSVAARTATSGVVGSDGPAVA